MSLPSLSRRPAPTAEALCSLPTPPVCTKNLVARPAPCFICTHAVTDDSQTPASNPADTQPPTPPAAQKTLSGGQKALRAILALILVTGLAVCAVALAVGFALREAKDAAGSAVQRVEGIAAAFKQGRIDKTFHDELTRIFPVGGGNLEVFVFETTQTLESRDELNVAWGLLPLGKTVTSLKVPVTYRYHIRLDDPWQVNLQGNVCLVQAPRIRPSLPPAVRTDRMELKTSQGWARFNGDEAREELLADLHVRLQKRAREYEPLAREHARQTVSRFIETWLLSHRQFGDDRIRAVVVRFPGDSPELPAAPPAPHPDLR